MSEMNRREFVTITVSAAACACLGASSVDALAAAGETPTTAPVGALDAGAAADYPADGIFEKYAKSHKILIIRNEGKIYASSALCTHKSCTLRMRDPKTIVCKCHGSMFSAFGTVTKGPAKASLVRYAISQNDAGHLVIDTSKEFRESKWEASDSFVSVT